MNALTWLLVALPLATIAAALVIVRRRSGGTMRAVDTRNTQGEAEFAGAINALRHGVGPH